MPLPYYGPSSIKTSYLREVYSVDDFSKVIQKAIATARCMMKDLSYDTIAFTGTSGAAVAYILSVELGVPLICVRKEQEKSHYITSNGLVEGYIAARRYIIVDDFIASGDTIKKIISTIQSVAGQAKCVGILLYRNSYGKPVDDKKFAWYDYNNGPPKLIKEESYKVYNSNTNDTPQLQLNFNPPPPTEAKKKAKK